MKYGLLDYELVGGKFNIGDYVQSLAAKQYLPKVDHYLSREKLDKYSGDKLKFIANGWFMHNPENWPPSPKLDALPVSIHINRPYAQRMLTTKSVNYFKKFDEVGCRDYHTAELLCDKGVNAYYSCCLTTTLKKPADIVKKKQILIIDALHAVPDFLAFKKMPLRYFLSHLKSGNFFRSFYKDGVYKKIIDTLSLGEDYDVIYIKNSLDGEGVSTEVRFKMAESYLKELASSSLVLTSRIHAALPCLAYNTPVVFLKFGQKSLSNTYRFKGIIDHMNVIDFDGDLRKSGYTSNEIGVEDLKNIASIVNPGTHLQYAEKLTKKCMEFIGHV